MKSRPREEWIHASDREVDRLRGIRVHHSTTTVIIIWCYIVFIIIVVIIVIFLVMLSRRPRDVQLDY